MKLKPKETELNITVTELPLLGRHALMLYYERGGSRGRQGAGEGQETGRKLTEGRNQGGADGGRIQGGVDIVRTQEGADGGRTQGGADGNRTQGGADRSKIQGELVVAGSKIVCIGGVANQGSRAQPE